MTKEKGNLETLSEADVKAIFAFTDEITARFRSMGEIVDRMNYRAEQFIRDCYTRSGTQRGHSVYSGTH